MVHAAEAYPVYIGGGLLDHCGELTARHSNGRCAVICDDTVCGLYGPQVCRSLEAAGLSPVLYAFPAGEQHKTLSTYGAILGFLAENHITRSDCVIALGGGVTGDMAGFAAATYQRGIDFIQVPTTFLAASDASVGGKTAVDLPAGKNLAGAFWQPRAVICDTDTFATLPESAFQDGAAETLKHGLIADGEFFHFLMSEDMYRHMDAVVRRNVEIKAAVVAEDEREQGKRKLLNFGHTLGHAIEKCSGYRVSHGHAVATGMVLAARPPRHWAMAGRARWKQFLPPVSATAFPLSAPIPPESCMLPPSETKSAPGATSTWWSSGRWAGRKPCDWIWRACGNLRRRPYEHYH